MPMMNERAIKAGVVSILCVLYLEDRSKRVRYLHNGWIQRGEIESCDRLLIESFLGLDDSSTLVGGVC